MWNYLRTKLLSSRKSFTLVEVIIAMSIGSGIIITVYNSFTNALTTINDSSIEATMDNYADSIRYQIRNELLSAKNIETGITRRRANKVDGAADKYDALYYSSKDSLGCAIMLTNSNIDGRDDVVNSNLTINFTGTTPTNHRILKTLFNSESSNNVYIENLYFDISNIDIPGYQAGMSTVPNYDTFLIKTNLLTMGFDLIKYYPNGDTMKKSYTFKEMIECSNQG